MKKFVRIGFVLLAGLALAQVNSRAQPKQLLITPKLGTLAAPKLEPFTLKELATPDPADLIFYNAKVITVDSNFTVTEAVAIRENRIYAVGPTRDLAAYQGPATRVIDARGRTILPGLYDGNVNAHSAAVSEINGALPSPDSIGAALVYIRKQAAQKPPGSWIILQHLFPTRLKEGRLPTKAELDSATTNNPVLWNFGPIAVVNSTALEYARIGRETQDPKRGEIIKDPKTHKPTGVLRNTAINLLHLPPAPRPPTLEQKRESLKRLVQLYNRQGITSIGEQDTAAADIDLFRDLSRTGELTVRVNCARLLDPGTNDIDGAIALLDTFTNNPRAGGVPYGPTGVGDDWVRVGPLKAVLDGQLAIASSYLRTPYGIGQTYRIVEPAYRGELKGDPKLLSELCREAASRGWQLTAHCSGDAALDFALNCFERVQFDRDIRQARFSVFHNDFQATQSWQRCNDLNLGVTLIPNDLYLDGAVVLKTLGEKRTALFLPIKGWFDHGLVAGAGSGHYLGTDSADPKNPWNPWQGLWVALTRRNESGGIVNLDERITREQAIRLYTLNNAWLHFEDKRKGSLEIGKFADLIVVDTDLMQCPVDDIRATKVLLTMVNGKIVWDNRPDSPTLNLSVTGK
jgi:predicted amidohydrolase YtcJ